MYKQHTFSALRRHYGRESEQYGHLHVSRSDPERGTVVLFHGGFWRRHRDLTMTTPMAHALAEHGWNVWNVEYRRGDPAIWRQSTADCLQALDHVGVIAEDLGLDREKTVLVGHSAGAYLAAWVAAHSDYRETFGGRVSGLVTLNGVLDLHRAATTHLGDDAVPEFLGTTPDDGPDTYAEADASVRLPPMLASRCLHSRNDERVPFDVTEHFVESAQSTCATIRLVEIDGHHTAPIEPGSVAWRKVLRVIDSFGGQQSRSHKALQEHA